MFDLGYIPFASLAGTMRLRSNQSFRLLRFTSMFVPLWLYPFQRRLFSLRALKSRNARRRPPVHCRVQLCLESLEDRLAPSADLVTVAAGNLSTSFSESTQKLTLTATVQ